jgi:Kef-type K+ transport system membrane component KefB
MIGAEGDARVPSLANIPPIAQHQLLVFLLQLAAVLMATTTLALLAKRLRMPAITGELLAGILLGPSLFGHVAPALSHWLLPQQAEQQHLLDAVGQLGAVLLVAITGMQIDLNLLRRNKLTIARISLAGLVIPLLFGIGVAYFVPQGVLADRQNRTTFALFLGVALAVSAVPVIAKTLTDMGLMHRDIAQLIMASALVDDMVGWLLLSIVSAIVFAQLSTGTVALAVMWILVTVVVTVLGRLLVNVALTAVEPTKRGREGDIGPARVNLILTIAVGGVLLAAAATTSLGLEAVFGAFAAGIILGALPPRFRASLASLRVVVHGVLAPLYFAIAGLHADVSALIHPTMLVVVAVILTVAITTKFFGAYIGAKASRLSNAEAVALGAGLNSRGVIQIVVATTGLRLGVLSTDIYTAIIVTAVVTSLMAPLILRVAVGRIASHPSESQREKNAWDYASQRSVT